MEKVTLSTAFPLILQTLHSTALLSSLHPFISHLSFPIPVLLLGLSGSLIPCPNTEVLMVFLPEANLFLACGFGVPLG